MAALDAGVANRWGHVEQRMGRDVTWIARYIPHHLAELYACQGWRIVSLGRYHGNFSMLAIMEWEE